MVAFHAMMNTFIAASIQSAFEPISVDFGVSLQTTSYLVSLFIAVLGVAPFFWCPIADRWGRRPVFLVSMIVTAVGNIGCAVSPNYSSMAGCRAVTAFFVSPAAAIGTGVVADMFFKKERGRFIGVWTVMITIGVPVAPFIFGFVALRISYRWIFWILAIVRELSDRCYASS
jgi:multidrug resistance protein